MEKVSFRFIVLSVMISETETSLIQYLFHIYHFCMPKMKYMIRGNILSGKCQLRNCPSGKCSFGEFSVCGTALRATIRRRNVFGELSVGEMSVGEKSVGEMSIREPSWNLLSFVNYQMFVIIQIILHNSTNRFFQI